VDRLLPPNIVNAPESWTPPLAIQSALACMKVSGGIATVLAGPLHRPEGSPLSDKQGSAAVIVAL